MHLENKSSGAQTCYFDPQARNFRLVPQDVSDLPGLLVVFPDQAHGAEGSYEDGGR